MDVMVWLRSLGLGQYEAAFRQNDIDVAGSPSQAPRCRSSLPKTAPSGVKSR
jgi:hypothetical protein